MTHRVSLIALAALALPFCVFIGCDTNDEQVPIGSDLDSKACSTDVDCSSGELCMNGACTPGAACTAGPESCNGIDDDCDGVVDNDTTCPGGGTCVGGGCNGGAGGAGNSGNSVATAGVGGAGSSGNSVATVGAGGAGAGGGNGISLLLSELPDPGSGVSSVASGGGADPSTVLVVVGDSMISCDNPSHVDCDNHWSFTLSLPPALQQPGTYTLEEVGGTMDETGPGSPSCAEGLGSYWDGMVEITSIDATSVVGTIFANPSAIWSNNPSGAFVAPRCF